MNRLLQIIVMAFFAMNIMQCSTSDMVKLKNNRKQVFDAYENKHLLSVQTKSSDVKFVGFVTSLDKNKDSFLFKKLNSNNTSQISINHDLDLAALINYEEKIRLCLSDNSFLIGTISSSDLEKNNISFVAHNKKYTIPVAKILELKYFDVSKVKLIFIDGSEMFGSIVKEDGDKIFITTILGDQSYPRDEILRIDYVK